MNCRECQHLTANITLGQSLFQRAVEKTSDIKQLEESIQSLYPNFPSTCNVTTMEQFKWHAHTKLHITHFSLICFLLKSDQSSSDPPHSFNSSSIIISLPQNKYMPKEYPFTSIYCMKRIMNFIVWCDYPWMHTYFYYHSYWVEMQGL